MMRQRWPRLFYINTHVSKQPIVKKTEEKSCLPKESAVAQSKLDYAMLAPYQLDTDDNRKLIDDFPKKVEIICKLLIAWHSDKTLQEVFSSGRFREELWHYFKDPVHATEQTPGGFLQHCANIKALEDYENFFRSLKESSPSPALAPHKDQSESTFAGVKEFRL